ncbi:hypothetical protein L1987_80712 [Smallanthus sonchifolius]|uniref:Uncharacterized protein n=1 Tax=Smallanthus sonchifolius TaxID=185202 RepID=A0ACB8YMU8_9ASTR|nr:hypothetical protein L1987_80712 [Smallanthus sonchifolius]
MHFQLDNNNFDGEIPASYGNLSELVKLSLRNCSLQGVLPDLSRIPKLSYMAKQRKVGINKYESFNPIPRTKTEIEDR